MSRIHHFEVTVDNLHQRLSQFKEVLGFEVFAHKYNTQGKGIAVALRIDSIVVVLQTTECFSQLYSTTPEAKRLMPNASDWVSNVALVMDREEFDKVSNKLFTSSEIDVIQTNCTEPQPSGGSQRSTLQVAADETSSHANVSKSDSTRTSPATGSHTQSNKIITIRSPFADTYHTLMEKGHCDCLCSLEARTAPVSDMFCSSCLPGFAVCPRLIGQSCSVCDEQFGITPSTVNTPPSLTHIDHVTFACNTATSESLLTWYSEFLHFSEFAVVNTTSGKGYILEGSNGMRLSAMQYWLCSETRVHNSDSTVQFIFAEPLGNSGSNQVQTFLNNNDGPGIQHIAFHTNDIVQDASVLLGNGLPFITPPPDYYSIISQTVDFSIISENLKLLKDTNVLIDVETVKGKAESHDSVQYLLQVFSQALFDRDTFFIELITRHGGAQGFGAGNISALWKALDIHLAGKIIVKNL